LFVGLNNFSNHCYTKQTVMLRTGKLCQDVQCQERSTDKGAEGSDQQLNKKLESVNEHKFCVQKVACKGMIHLARRGWAHDS